MPRKAKMQHPEATRVEPLQARAKAELWAKVKKAAEELRRRIRPPQAKYARPSTRPEGGRAPTQPQAVTGRKRPVVFAVSTSPPPAKTVPANHTATTATTTPITITITTTALIHAAPPSPPASRPSSTDPAASIPPLHIDTPPTSPPSINVIADVQIRPPFHPQPYVPTIPIPTVDDILYEHRTKPLLWPPHICTLARSLLPAGWPPAERYRYRLHTSFGVRHRLSFPRYL